MTGGGTIEAASPRTGRGPVLVSLMLAMGLAAMDTTIVATAVPQIVSDIGGFSLFSWLFSIYLLTQTVTIPLYGKLADLYGRKPILLGGIMLFLTGSALCSAAWSMVALIAFRGLQGLGAGSIQATVQTIAGDLYSLEERGRVQGWLSSVWGIAAIAGPTLGGVFADYASWRWIFLVNLPIGLAALLLLARHLKETPVRTRHRIDYLGSVFILLACGALVLGLLQGGVAWPWWSVRSVAVFVVSVALGAVAVRVERRASEPVVPSWVWRRPVLAGSNLGYLGLGLMVIGPSTFLPTYAQTVLGLGAVAAGFVLASMSITWPLASALCNRLYLRIGFRDTAVLGAVIALVAVAAFPMLAYRCPVWQPVALTMLLGAGFGLLSTPIVVGLQSTVPRHERGVATGSIMFNRYLGQSLGAAIFGAIANTTLRHRLQDAPAALRNSLPHSINEVTSSITGHHVSGASLGYLRHAMDAATEHVYWAITVCVVLTIVAVVVVAPRRFPLLDGDTEAAQPKIGANSSVGGPEDRSTRLSGSPRSTDST